MSNLVNNAQNIPVYKSGDIILLDDEYCLSCDIYTQTNIFTKTFVKVYCPHCNEEINECVGASDISCVPDNDKTDVLTTIYQHLRVKHSNEFVAIKNNSFNWKTKIAKFTLVKKIFM